MDTVSVRSSAGKWRAYSIMFILKVMQEARYSSTGEHLASIVTEALGDLAPVVKPAGEVLAEMLRRGERPTVRSLLDELEVFKPKDLNLDAIENLRAEFSIFDAPVIDSLDELLLQVRKYRICAAIEEHIAEVQLKRLSVQDAVQELSRLYSELYSICGSYFPERTVSSLLEAGDSLSFPGHLVHRPFPVPKGVLGIVASLGGVGKSMLMLLLALSAASAGKRVLYISFEDPEWVIKSRVEQIERMVSVDEGWTPLENPNCDFEYLHDLITVTCADPELVLDPRTLALTSFGGKLVSYIRSKIEAGAELVVIDPIAGLVADENDNAYVTKFAGVFSALVREACRMGHYSTVLLVHHVSKGMARLSNAREESFNGAVAVRGATGLVNAAKYVVELCRLSQLDGEYVMRIATNLAEALGFSVEMLPSAPRSHRHEVLVVHNTKNNYCPVFAPVLVTITPGEMTGRLGIAAFEGSW